MYKSPIEITEKQMRMEFEDCIWKTVQDYAVSVDKEELLKALRYDRDQYNKGYADGKIVAMKEILRCKDCIHAKYNDYEGVYECGKLKLFVNGEFYCFYGIRRTNDE